MSSHETLEGQQLLSSLLNRRRRFDVLLNHSLYLCDRIVQADELMGHLIQVCHGEI